MSYITEVSTTLKTAHWLVWSWSLEDAISDIVFVIAAFELLPNFPRNHKNLVQKSLAQN